MNTLCILCFPYVAFYSERNSRKRILAVSNDSGLTRHRSLKIRAGLRPLFSPYKKTSRVNSVQSQLGGRGRKAPGTGRKMKRSDSFRFP